MGITTALTSSGKCSRERNMKFLAIFALAAAVSAEADPYYLGGYGLGYTGLGYAGYGGYAGLGYAAPVVAAGQVSASISGSTSVNIAGLAPAAVPAAFPGYAGAGRYVANSGGVVHVAKREADPYYGYGGYGLGYAGLGYAGLGYAAGQVSASLSGSTSVNIAGLAPAAVPAAFPGYAGAGRYVANSG